MSTRPAQSFVWATTGSKVDPGSGKKDIGFLVAERPPRSWFNYLFNLIGQWIAYLTDVAEVQTVYIPASAGIAENATFTFTDTTVYWTATSAAGIVLLPLTPRNRDTITKVEVFFDSTTTTAQGANLERKRVSLSHSADTLASDTTPAATGFHKVTLDVTELVTDAAQDFQWYIRCRLLATGNRVMGARVTYNRNP